MSKAHTKEIVIRISDWADNVEAWQENIYAFMVYGKDMLNFMREQHPETAKAFMEARKNSKGKITMAADYPSMIQITDGKYFDQQIETMKYEAQQKVLQDMIDKPNEYVRLQNG
jgi:DNA modification methylase